MSMEGGVGGAEEGEEMSRWGWEEQGEVRGVTGEGWKRG